MPQEAERPLPGCIIMSDGRFKFSTEQQQAAFVHRSAGAVLPYWEAARVANSFYAKQHGCEQVKVAAGLDSQCHVLKLPIASTPELNSAVHMMRNAAPQTRLLLNAVCAHELQSTAAHQLLQRPWRL